MSSWKYRGTVLDTLGVVTLVSDSFAMPALRGGNVLIPFRPGRVYVEKLPEQRTLELGLAIQEDTLEALEAEIDTVKTLLGAPGLGALTQTLESGSIRSCQAEFTGDLHPTRISPLQVKMALEFTCPSPFFLGSTLVTDEHTINASPKTYSINNPGSAYQRDPVITLTGPLNNVSITNSTNGCVLTYSGSIPSPRVVTIQTDPNTGEYVATNDLGVNVIGNLTHSGATALLVFNSGTNNLSVTDGLHTTGKVKIEFYPPYL